MVYPNPTDNDVTINWTGLIHNETILTITDISGRIVLTKSLEATNSPVIELNINDLVSGSYFLFLSNNYESSSALIIKTN